MPRALARPALAALVFSLVTGCAVDAPVAAPRSTAEVLRARADVLSAWPALWDQLLATGVHAHISGTSAYAEDFVVPSGATWSLTDIVLAGTAGVTFVGDQQVLQPITLTILTDAGGTIGSPVASFTLAPSASEPNACGTCSRSDLLFHPPQPVALTAGSYWLQVSLPAGSFFTWAGSTQSVGATALWSYNGDPFTPTTIHLAFALYGSDGSPASQATALQISLTGMGLDAGTFTSLNAKLRNLATAIAAGDTAAACSALKDFVNQVNALAGKKKLSAAQAATLLSAAAQLQQQLGCG